MEAVGGHKKGFKLLRSSSEAIARRAKRGFSLIEAAIVLAVVGGVIGAIWVAAANMIENYKVNKTVSDFSLIVKDTQNLISIRDSEAIGNMDINATLRYAGIYPKDWVNGTIVKHPFNGYISISNDAAGFFWINLYSVPKSACIKLIVKMSSLKTLRSIGSGPNGILNFPASSETAEGVCINPSQTVGFSFFYTRNN